MNTALEVKEDGQIWLIPDAPTDPRDMIPAEEFSPYVSSYAAPYLKQYEKELASAERYLVGNQEVARELLFLKHCIFPKEIALKEVAGIYPIPDLKWEMKEELEYPIDHTSYPPYRKVAVISIPESKKEESQEKLMSELLTEYRAMRKRGATYFSIELALCDKFTITRKP